MTERVVITSAVTWTRGSGTSPLPTEGAAAGRRRDPQATALVGFARALLDARPVEVGELPRDETAVVIGTALGSAATDLAFIQGVEARGAAFGSPATFVYTLSTAAPAEVALALGLRGGVSTVAAGAASGLAAIAAAGGRIASGQVRASICGGVEWVGAEPEFLALFLLERSDAEATALPRLAGWEAGFEPERARAPGVTVGETGLAALVAAVAARKEGGVATSSVTALDWDGHWVTLRVGL